MTNGGGPRSVALGVGSYLPARRLTNADLVGMVDTSEAWIVERTGIRARHIAAEGETTSDLAVAAARRALERAELPVEAVDLIVCATSTPDNTFPATATAVQRKLGLEHGVAFDVQAVCSGFVYGLCVADGLLRTGQARTALVIGAETYSRIVDWQDRGTCVLFGDGAGALVLQASEGAGRRGLLAHQLGSDGRYYEQLFVDGGPGSTGTVGHLRMQGREVFRHAVSRMAEASLGALERAGLTLDEVDWLVPHQANQRILDAVARKLELDPVRVISTVARHANTSAASIPLALAEADAGGRLKPGQLLVLAAMGGGFTWGASVLRW